MVNDKMFCRIINVWGIQWITFKVKIIKKRTMKSTEFFYHGSTDNYIKTGTGAIIKNL